MRMVLPRVVRVALPALTTRRASNRIAESATFPFMESTPGDTTAVVDVGCALFSDASNANVPGRFVDNLTTTTFAG